MRVSSHDAAEIGRALDLGAAGVIVPMVESAADAAAVVAACRWAPEGRRSWAPMPAAVTDPICAVMVETVRGVRAAAEIAQTPGVDVVFVGPGDLARSLGLAPALAPADPPLERAILDVRAACAEAGTVCGIFAGAEAPAATWARAGFLMIALAVDAVLVREGAARLLEAAREGLAEGLEPSGGMDRPPRSVHEQVAWLVDRAAISDLLVEELRCLDMRDFQGLQSLFVDDGYLQMPGFRIEAQRLAQAASEQLGSLAATHHLSTNHAIEIDGDTARARSYFLAVHVESDPHVHSDLGGWSDTTFRRTGAVWKIASIEETYVWRSGASSS